MNQANWNDILGKAKEFGKAVGDVAGEVVDASRQKLDEMKKRRELEECDMKLDGCTMPCYRKVPRRRKPLMPLQKRRQLLR